MSGFFEELKRRNVFRVGVGYLVLSWLILQIGALLAPILGLPEIALSFVVFALVLGFPLALLFAWAYELTPDGLKRSGDVAADPSVTSAAGRRFNIAISGFLTLVVVVLLADRFYFSKAELEPEAIVDADGDVPLGERSYDSIAVLPFVNMSDDKSQEYFSDGISEELLNLLAKTKGLRVAARTSSFAFKGRNQNIKGIGEELDVETILEGSVRRSAKTLRITAQLIDVESGYHLWSDTFDRELTDVFAIQDEISAAIVAALAVHFDGVAVEAPKSTQGDVRAYEEFLLGRERILLRTKEDIEAADAHFRKAIEIDPDYAPAYAGRSDAIMLLSDQNGAYGTMPVHFAVELARPLVEKSLALEPDLPDAHRALGRILHDQGDLEGAVVSYTRATDLRPSSPIAWMWKADALNNLNRWGDARDAIDTAHRYDPRSAVILSNLGSLARDAGDIAKMKMVAAKVNVLGSGRTGGLKFIEGVIQRDTGQYAEAFRTFGGETEPWLRKESSIALAFTCFNLAHRACALDIFPAAQVWINMAFNDLESARRDLALIDSRFPGRRFVEALKLKMAVMEGDWSLANQILDRLAEGNPYSEFGPLFDDEGSPTAFVWLKVKREIGDEEAVVRMLATIERFALRQEKEGLEAYLPISRAMISLYRGDEDQAMVDLREAHGAYLLRWKDRFDPVIQPFHDNPEFKALMAEVDAHINAERAKLGWTPMEGLE